MTETVLAVTDHLKNTQATMHLLASQTGGRAFLNGPSSERIIDGVREDGGLLGAWVEQVPLAGGMVSATTVLLVAAAMLAQLSTANIVVRLVLASVGALKPAGQPQASDRLRGGRILGPMERLLILGLGLAGQPTAAGLVIAAKGLIRFPELQAQARASGVGRGAGGEPGIDEITEYFLIGSFVSWLFALAALAFVVVFA